MNDHPIAARSGKRRRFGVRVRRGNSAKSVCRRRLQYDEPQPFSYDMFKARARATHPRARCTADPPRARCVKKINYEEWGKIKFSHRGREFAEVRAGSGDAIPSRPFFQRPSTGMSRRRRDLARPDHLRFRVIFRNARRFACAQVPKARASPAQGSGSRAGVAD